MPTSPRSVRTTTEKNEALFIFEKRTDFTDDNINGSGYENGCSKVVVEGNKVYYHGSSNHKSDNKVSNGSSDTARYRHEKFQMEKENECESSSKIQRIRHMIDENYYDEQTCSSYSKYSRRDGPWKNRLGGSNKSNSSNKATKPYPSDYTAFNSSSSSGSGSGSGNSTKKQFDDTMFPFDRAAFSYDAGSENNIEWTKRNQSSYRNSNNNYYDSSSPDYDYYEQFRSAQRKSTASNASSDGRLLKELSSQSRKQSLKMSKYDHPPSPSLSIKNDQNHEFKNHISEPDAFSIPNAKLNAKTNSTSPDNTTIITTSSHNNATSISIVSQSSNSINDRNPFSKFEQIASKFDRIPSKLPPHDRKYFLNISIST